MSYLNQKVVVTIEARMAATRLPGKMMLPLLGGTVLSWVVSRCAAAKYVDEVVVASTEAECDQVLSDECARLGVRCYRGPIEDITMRLLEATEQTLPDYIIQITGDCPLIDPVHIERTIECLIDQDADYATNNLDNNLPIGLDVRGIRRSALVRSAALSDDPIDRIHGTYHIARSPEIFRHTSWNPDDVDGLHGLRLTLDEPADYQCIRTLLEVLKPQTVTFPIRVLEDIIKALPDMRLINAHVQQKHVAQG